VVPFVVVIFYLSAHYNERTQRQTLENAATVARLVAAKGSLVVAQSGQMLASLALLADNGELLGPRCPNQLAKLLTVNPGNGCLAVADRGGNILCSTQPSAKSFVNVSMSEPIGRVVATGETTVSGLVESQLTGKKVLVVLHPIVDRERLVGVLRAEVELGWMQDVLSRAQLPEGSVVSLVDGKGVTLARFPDAGPHAISADRSERLAASARIEDLPAEHAAWVRVSMPESTLRADSLRTVRNGMLVTGGTLVLFFVLLWAGATFVTRRVPTFVPGPEVRKLSGRYRASTGERYTYEVDWNELGDLILWNAQVREGGSLVGMPSGELPLGLHGELKAALQREVEAAIEQRLAID
jgi:hypothetical protein